MEFKVWVDGMSRVVCGVTYETTCQDIVIALAHATGRIGRFSLIEKWRQTERSVPPNERPLQLLQKWGEYATDVQYFLIQNKDAPNEKRDDLHNYSDPYAGFTDKTRNKSTSSGHDNVVKRSLTFTGVHGMYNPATLIKHSNNVNKLQPLKENSVTEKVFNPPVSPIFQENNIIPQNRQNIERNSNNNNSSSSRLPLAQSYDSLERPRQRKISPRRMPLFRKIPGNKVSDSSELDSIVNDEYQSPYSHSRTQFGRIVENESRGDNSREIIDKRQNHVRNGDVRQAITESPYSRYQNGGTKIPTDHRPPPVSKPVISEEYMNLVRLVVSQQERLHLQTEKIHTVDSDLSSMEEAVKNDESELRKLNKEMENLQEAQSSNEREISVDDVSLLDQELQQQKHTEETLQSELVSEQERLKNCERNLTDVKNKINYFSQRLEAEREKSTKGDNSAGTQSLKSDLVLSDLHNEVNVLEAAIKDKQKQLGDLEVNLKEVNMIDFNISSPPAEQETGIFKQLTRPASTNPTKRGENNSTTVITPPDGVWV